MDGTNTLDQGRQHSMVNELYAIDTISGALWSTPSFDAAGNANSVPQPISLSTPITLTYDAWNRLVTVMNSDLTVATYAYDGQNRRISKTLGSKTRDYFYTAAWQIIEEQVGESGELDRQFVWGLMGLDNIILRDRQVRHGDESSSGSSDSDSDFPSSSSGGAVVVTERLYALYDYASVTALVNTSGAVVERYGYNAFGTPQFMNADFGHNSTSIFDWETLYACYRYDAETGFYQVRNRFYHPTLGRFINRDPIGLAGGVNLYAYVGNNAVNRVDCLGLLVEGPGTIPGTSFVPSPQPPSTPTPTPVESPAEEAWELGEEAAEGAEALGGGPEDPIADIVAGGILLGALLDAAFDAITNPALAPAPSQAPDCRRGYTCKAKCQGIPTVPGANCPPWLTGSGTGSTETIACQAAKKDATGSAPQGCYGRHCSCDCSPS